jgi:hypothetical protein
MPPTPVPPIGESEVTILSRVLVDGKDLSPEQAHYFLELGFGEEDKARMHDLAVRNQAGALSAQEQEELVAYAKAGCLLGILQSKARKHLKSQNRAS